MRMVNISEKAQLSSLIGVVMAGKEILIGKAGRPVPSSCLMTEAKSLVDPERCAAKLASPTISTNRQTI